MTGYEWLIMLLAFSILINACYIGLRIYDTLAERRERRLQDKFRHPAYRNQFAHPVHLDEWRRQRDLS